MPEMSIEAKNSIEKKARRLRIGANALSLGRAAVGVATGTGIAVYSGEYRSWPLSGVVGAAAYTDWKDGKMARKAADLLQKQSTKKVETTRFGKWIDQLSDKIFAHALFIGIGIHELVQGSGWEKAYGLGLLAADAYFLKRDINMTQVRVQLESEQKEIKARSWGKYKTALGLGTLAVAVSPLAQSGDVQGMVVAGTAATVGLAAYSLKDMKQQLELPAPTFQAPLTGEAA